MFSKTYERTELFQVFILIISYNVDVDSIKHLKVMVYTLFLIITQTFDYMISQTTARIYNSIEQFEAKLK
jgi:hypothetical protein